MAKAQSRTRRYDRPALLERLRTIPKDNLAITVHGSGVPGEAILGMRDIMADLFTSCVEGRLSEWPFSGMTLSADTPGDDFRRKIYSRAYLELEELGSVGAAFIGGPLPPEVSITALQVVRDGKAPHVRMNGAIRGVFWAIVEPDWLWTGWELPAEERDSTSHITVLQCTVERKSACLVYWNAAPLIIRAASPERLLQMTDNSIGVGGLRQRWSEIRPQVDAEDIRSFYWQAEKAGMHSDQIGHYVSEQVERRLLAGLPDRRTPYRPPLPLLDFDTLSSSTGNPEEELMAEESAAFNSQQLDELREVASEEQLKLVDALLDGWKADPHQTMAAIGRDKGWSADDVYAVLKQLRRKADSLR